MKELYIKHIAGLMDLRPWQVENCVEMFAQGDTIPFISRYRKEKTGGMDDADIAQVKHLADVYDDMEKRKATIIKTIDEAGALTDELRERIENLTDQTELEDLYLPWKPKRRTRATAARELGLEGLADLIWQHRSRNPELDAQRFVCGSAEMKKAALQGAPDAESALSGARDIIAERISEEAPIREAMRASFRQRRIVSKLRGSGKDKADAAKYRSYFDYSFPLARIPSHNLLAILRAETEGIVSVSLDTDAEKCCAKIYYEWARKHGYAPERSASQIKEAIADSFKRLIEPSISAEVIREAKEKADRESIKIFGDNLRQLLMGAPVGQKRTMAIDPGFRNGCKIVCLDRQGELLHHQIIYPHPPQNEKVKSIMALQSMIDKYGIEAVAIGNGTASRETEELMRKVSLPEGCKVWTVSEDGASIYSASEAARKEFPDQDVTVRGAVSIGRRLMDPLSELVKIDPKNLGVGQYQHDVDQGKLKKSLDLTVESCVNSVGVNLNTASQHLLTYVSGLGPTLAKNIVDYRREHGAFTSRAQLKKVPRLGPVAYEQCAGFLRIPESDNPLDNSAVHPESYKIVEQMARDNGCTVRQLMTDASLREKIELRKYVSDTVGMPTLTDIMSELEKPGRDPRSQIEEFEFAAGINSIDDLRAGMTLPGIVTNITNFGAFVDVGVHQDGLVHISQLADRYVSDPNEVVKLHQHVRVKVTEVDKRRNRISLTMRGC